MQTFSNTLAARANKLIDAAIAAEVGKMAVGAMSKADYKRSAGIVRGLAVAKEILVQAESELLKG